MCLPGYACGQVAFEQTVVVGNGMWWRPWWMGQGCSLVVLAVVTESES